MASLQRSPKEEHSGGHPKGDATARCSKPHIKTVSLMGAVLSRPHGNRVSAERVAGEVCQFWLSSPRQGCDKLSEIPHPGCSDLALPHWDRLQPDCRTRQHAINSPPCIPTRDLCVCIWIPARLGQLVLSIAGGSKHSTATADACILKSYDDGPWRHTP